MKSDFLYPIRVLHGKMHEYKLRKQHEYSLRKQLCYPRRTNAYIFGTPTHTNLGDSAIVLAQVHFLECCGFSPKQIKELTMDEYKADKHMICKALPRKGLIAQLGGGNMGSQWLMEEYLHRNLLTNHPHNPQIIFPQTIHYLANEEGDREKGASIPIYNNRKKLTMIAREKMSYKIMQELYPQTPLLLTPDIVLSMTVQDFGVKPQVRDGVMLCFRSDAEKAMTEEQRTELLQSLDNKNLSYHLTDMHATEPITKENRGLRVREKMEEFARAELVVTDRLHGMIFAAITGTPCIVFGNYNHKVKGTYEWIRDLTYIRYVETVTEAEQLFSELIAMKNCFYDNAPLQPYYDQIKKVVKQYAEN